MNSNKSLTGSKTLLLFLVLGSLTLTSCLTHTIKTSNQPSLQTGSPLKGVRPLRVYVGEFQDVRGLAPDFAGLWVNHKYNLDKPVSQVVRDSIQSEFQRNGHICLGTEQQSQADIAIEGSVYQYMFAFDAGRREMAGYVGVKISVKAASRPNDVFSKKYDGNYTLTGFLLSTHAPHKVLNEAHLNMIKEFTTDQEFLDFLKRTGS